MNRWKMACLVTILALPGCGESVAPPPKEDLVPVSGTIKIGGQPAEGVSVSFVPAGSTTGQGATGVTNKEGHYELIHGASQKPGAPVGEYTVNLSKWVMPDGSPLPADKPPHMVNAKNEVPDRWGEKMPGGRGNQVKVPAGGGTIDFDIPK